MTTTTHASKAVAIWLFIGAFLVAAIVITGGITRLTNSGLSIVSWKPISGIIPPLNSHDWAIEFGNYKTSPEFALKNSNFKLDDFKSIFWWEYTHRLFARIIGLVFVFPFLFFYFTKKLKHKKLRKHLLIIFFLGLFQGFLGWFMVMSGLIAKPSVNHYRLAAHLLAALILFAYILWVALNIYFPDSAKKQNNYTGIRNKLFGLNGLIALQIVYGAFMAGLKAGYFYPSFPKMGSYWIPENMFHTLTKEGFPALFENPLLVQFIHRWIPLFIIGLVLIILYKSLKEIALSITQKWMIYALVTMIGIQVLLGIYTILYSVPINLAVFHQFGAVILLGLNVTAIFFFSRKNIFM